MDSLALKDFYSEHLEVFTTSIKERLRSRISIEQRISEAKNLPHKNVIINGWRGFKIGMVGGASVGFVMGLSNYKSDKTLILKLPISLGTITAPFLSIGMALRA